MPYTRIEDYGIIGDLHTVALVSRSGSVDWFCLPRLDSPSVFGALLDERKGGRFLIAPTFEDVAHKQMYFPDTNVLITRFLSTRGVAEICDFMPVSPAGTETDRHRLIRRVSVVRGRISFRMLCRPAFDYARAPHTLELTPGGAVFRSPALHLGLGTSVPLRAEENGAVAEFALAEGETAAFTLQTLSRDDRDSGNVSATELDEAFRGTVAFWRGWIAGSRYRGRWREMVNRSALVLKLLTYRPTGAIVAAATCSLPGGLRAGRSWDYRYTWIRDASFTLYALMRIGLTHEAQQFAGWLRGRLEELGPEGSLQVMYGIDGRHDLSEEILPHLEGYRGLGPVRIGNNAFRQLQLDIYGELLDAIYLFNKYVAPIGYDAWVTLRRMLAWLERHWQDPDEGIWEVRSGREHFVYSKVMCWVAFDRALRLAEKRSLPADRVAWLRIRDAIYEEVMTQGWDPERRAFVQAYGSRALDASLLIMPLVFFLSPRDPRLLSTLEAIRRELVADSLVYRYNPERSADGLPGEEGTFGICSFWLVEALTRAGRVEEARLLFEKTLGYASHLGLYAEQIGPQGQALGNFPQAFTHLSLISAAFNLDRALGQEPQGSPQPAIGS
jgi:GH15 family glucan-1,4-alpha-glucosidase